MASPSNATIIQKILKGLTEVVFTQTLEAGAALGSLLVWNDDKVT